MAVEQTIQMLAPYAEIAEVRNHFSSLFSVPRGGIHNKSQVRVDVKRTKEAMAYPVQNIAAGWHYNERKGWSSKKLTPAVYKEKISIAADDLMSGDRAYGRNEFTEPGLMARLREEIGPLTGELQDMIARGLEFQASQIMTTGAMTLTDDNGNEVFSDNFAPKSTHFFNASTTWATTGSAVPLTDIATAANLNKTDGKSISLRAHMNSTTFAQFMAVDTVKAALSNDYRIDNGLVYRIDRTSPPANKRPVGSGIFRGTIQCQNYVIDLYTYDETYDDPQTDVSTKFLPDYKCVVESGGRMDATFGQLNSFGTTGARIPGVRLNGGTAKPMTNYTMLMWKENDGTAIHFGVGTRALLYPVAIDTFSCITTSGF